MIVEDEQAIALLLKYNLEKTVTIPSPFHMVIECCHQLKKICRR